MKKKWYLQTWLICLLFAFWFAYGIPLILGVLLLILKLKEEKMLFSQNEQLTAEVHNLNQLLTPEMQDAHALQNLVDSLHAEENHAKETLENTKKEIDKAISKKESELRRIEQEIIEKKKQIVWMDDEILVQEFGLYKPQFDFASALDYKEALSEIRASQKALIKNKQAVTGNTQWQVNGSAAKGKKWFLIHRNYCYVLLIVNVMIWFQKSNTQILMRLLIEYINQPRLFLNLVLL